MKATIFTFMCLLALTSRAQNASTKSQSFLYRTELKAGYSGNIIWQNGLNLGAEYLWRERIKVKERKRRKKRITQQLLFDVNLGITTNFTAKTDTGVFTNYGLIFRRTNTKEKQISIGFNPLGYYRSFLPETYEVTENGVNKIFLPGRGYYAPSFTVGIGKLRKEKKLSGWYLNLNIMLRTPYNGGTLPSVAFQYGYRFKLKN